MKSKKKKKKEEKTEIGEKYGTSKENPYLCAVWIWVCIRHIHWFCINERTIERNNKNKNQSKSKHILLHVAHTDECFSFFFLFLLARNLEIAFEQHIYLLISLLLRHAIVEFMIGRNNNNNNNDGIDCIAKPNSNNPIQTHIVSHFVVFRSHHVHIIYLLECFPLHGAYDCHINLVKRVRKSNHWFIFNVSFFFFGSCVLRHNERCMPISLNTQFFCFPFFRSIQSSEGGNKDLFWISH